MSEKEWRPAEEWEKLAGGSSAWDHEIVEVKFFDGTTGLASYGWDDETWDGWSNAWHFEDDLSRYVATPEFYRKLTETE